MSYYASDLQELYLPLLEGAFETPLWDAFLRNLLTRSQAHRAMLVVSSGEAFSPLILQARAARASAEPALAPDRIAALDLHAGRPLRPGRVYSRDELLDYDHAETLTRQRASLAEMGINFGRWMRVAAGDIEASLVLVREQEDFGAAASALIASTAAPLTAALRLRALHDRQQIATAMADLALGRLGVTQIALDRQARVLGMDQAARALLPVVHEPGSAGTQRLQLGTEAARALSAACAALWEGTENESRLVSLNLDKAPHLLLRRSENSAADGTPRTILIGSLRPNDPPPLPSAAAAPILIQSHGLSHREAELALAIAHGQSIAEAAQALGLTIETARNYSKIIYAKTATRGQADLTRLIHTSLAPLT